MIGGGSGGVGDGRRFEMAINTPRMTTIASVATTAYHGTLIFAASSMDGFG